MRFATAGKAVITNIDPVAPVLVTVIVRAPVAVLHAPTVPRLVHVKLGTSNSVAVPVNDAECVPKEPVTETEPVLTPPETSGRNAPRVLR